MLSTNYFCLATFKLCIAYIDILQFHKLMEVRFGRAYCMVYIHYFTICANVVFKLQSYMKSFEKDKFCGFT